MKTVKGLLLLQKPLLVREKVLGTTVNTVIKNFPLSISFPRLPTEQHDIQSVVHLKSPDETNWMNNKLVEWGYVSSQGCMVVEALTIQFICEDDQVEDQSYVVYSAIEKWEKRLSEYLSLCCKCYDRGGQDIHCGLTLRTDGRIIPSGLSAVIMINIHDSRSFVTNDIIQEAIAFASTETAFKAEYEMLLAAYEARMNNNNREVILDACSALELTIIRAIRKICADTGINADEIIEKKETLGQRYDRLRNMDPSCNFEIQGTVIALRNNVMHSKIIHPTDKETDALVAAIEEVMDHYYTGYAENES